jgi:hypothetical protein
MMTSFIKEWLPGSFGLSVSSLLVNSYHESVSSHGLHIQSWILFCLDWLDKWHILFIILP